MNSPRNPVATARPSTIHDIVRAVSVPVQTVSRVVNNSPDVAPLTRERDLFHHSRRGRCPATIAPSLATLRQRTLAVHRLDQQYDEPSMLRRDRL